VENWLYWIVIDAVSIFLYIDRELYQTVGLYSIYLVLAVIGYLAWRKAYFQQRAESS
jgi:nicotinamide mononucleotide transporter